MRHAVRPCPGACPSRIDRTLRRRPPYPAQPVKSLAPPLRTGVPRVRPPPITVGRHDGTASKKLPETGKLTGHSEKAPRSEELTLGRDYGDMRLSLRSRGSSGDAGHSAARMKAGSCTVQAAGDGAKARAEAVRRTVKENPRAFRTISLS